MSSRNKYHKYLLCIIAGAILPLSLAPFNWILCGVLSIAVAFLCIRNQPSSKMAWLLGFCYGIGMFGSGVSWVYVSIHDYGGASIALASLLTLMFILLLATIFSSTMFYLYCKLNCIAHTESQDKQQHIYCSQALLFSALWVLFEWLRSWLFTGFPWLFIGYSAIDTSIAGFAPVFGVYSLSFIIVFTTTIVTCLILSKGSDIKVWLATILMLILITISHVFLNNYQWSTTKSQLQIAAIQANIPQTTKWDSEFTQLSIDKHLQLTQTILDKDLIVWPENAIPVILTDFNHNLPQLNNLAKNNSLTIITGIPINDSSGKVYNSILSLGAINQKYDKTKLVPFGEYVPFESLLRGTIDFFDLPMSSFSAGNTNQGVLNLPVAAISASICYEAAYPDFIASHAKNSDFLVNISNDTWFGNSFGPFQHLQIARMRSLETGRWMIRATNSGITALINDKGNIIKQLAMQQPGVLSGTITTVTGSTPFMKLLSWPIILLCILIILTILRKSIALFSKIY
jgi:apolipoprotein N-acyltransferase